MRFHCGADHAGVGLKDTLSKWLAENGHEVVDHGTDSRERVDYPIFASAVARALVADAHQPEPSWGLLVCGSGIGVGMTANRFPGVRAVVASSEIEARLARAHNDANVLCLGERLTTPMLAEAILEAFLETPFEGGRHAERIAIIENQTIT